MALELPVRARGRFIPKFLPENIRPLTLFYAPDDAVRLDVANASPLVVEAPIYLERIKGETKDQENCRILKWQRFVSAWNARRDIAEDTLAIDLPPAEYYRATLQMTFSATADLRARGKTAVYKCLTDIQEQGLAALHDGYDALAPAQPVTVVIRDGVKWIAAPVTDTPNL